MFVRKHKCKTCGHRFAPLKSRIYTVTSLALYDAMDCLYCGCQVLLRERLPSPFEAEVIDFDRLKAASGFRKKY